MVNTMENAEEVMQVLDRFTRLKQKEIPKELDEYLQYVAKTGDTVFKWSSLKYLFREKLLNVIKAFHDNSPRVDEIPQYPNVDPFNYESMKSSLLERLELFNAAPFTIQRLCELLIDPRKQYSRIDKFMRALEKNILVSTVEPGRKRTESENGDSLDSVVNGDLSLDVNVDIDMVENEGIFAIETQNGNGAVPVVVPSAATADNLNESKEKLVVSSPIKSDVGTNAVRSGDDDILPHPKKAKLELHDNNAESKGTENNGEKETSPGEQAVAIAKITEANGTSTDQVEKKSETDGMTTKQDEKTTTDVIQPVEKNGNMKIEDNENNTSEAKITIEEAASKDNDEEMAEQKVPEQVKKIEVIVEPIAAVVVAKIMPEKAEIKEIIPEKGDKIKDNVVDEQIIREQENEKTKEKEEEKSIVECKNIKNAGKKGEEEQVDCTSKEQEKIPLKDTEVVVQQKENDGEKVKEVAKKELVVENKNQNEVCKKIDEVLSKETLEKDPKDNGNVEVVVAAVENGEAAVAVETKQPSAEESNKNDNILQEVASNIESEAKVEVEAPVELPKQADEKETVTATVLEIDSTATEKKMEDKRMVAKEEIPVDVEAPSLVIKPTDVVVAENQVEKIVFTSNIKANVDVVPPEVIAVEKPIVEATAIATDVKPFAEDKTEKPSDVDDTITADENVAAKSIEAGVEAAAATASVLIPQPATITSLDPISPAPLISAGIKVDAFELRAVADKDIMNTADLSAVATSTAAATLLEAVPIITEPILPTANDIIAPTLTLNDQPMEDLPMDEAVPEEVIMAETVTASIGSVIGGGNGLIEMATDAMEASSKDEPPVDGMDVDDTSQEAMDQ